MSITQNNIYEPYLMDVVDVRQETSDVKLVRVKFKNQGDAEGFSFEIGQFGLWSVFGVGESKYANWGTDGNRWGELPEGRILLQDHSDSTVSFRNLKIKEL